MTLIYFGCPICQSDEPIDSGAPVRGTICHDCGVIGQRIFPNKLVTADRAKAVRAMREELHTPNDSMTP